MSSLISPGSHKGKYLIPAVDQQDKKFWPAGREFSLSPVVPLVRRRVFNLLHRAWDGLAEDRKDTFSSREFQSERAVEPLSELLAFLEGQGLLERFLANVICPPDVSERDKDIDDIEGYLTRNIKLDEEVRMFWDFFSSDWAAETLRTVRSILTALRKGLSQAGTLSAPQGNAQGM